MQGDDFDAFYAEMRPKVARFIRARFPGDAVDDLTSETLLTLWCKDVPAPRDAPALARLRALTYAIAVGHIRNARRRLDVERRLVEAVGAACRDRLLGMEQSSPAQTLVEAIEEAVEKLAETDRHVLELDLAGLRSAEVAELLRISPKAASMRLSRARVRLRDMVDELRRSRGL